MELVIDHLLRLNPDRPQDALVNSALTITAAEAIRIEPLPLTRLGERGFPSSGSLLNQKSEGNS